MVTSKFVDECKKNAYRNRLGKFYIDGQTDPISGADFLQSIEFDDACYKDGKIIGTTYMKKATIGLIDTGIQFDFIDKIIRPQIGVKYDDFSEEWLNIGKYTIQRPNNEQTDNETKIIAYDDFRGLDNDYVCGIDFTIGDKTIADFYIDVCNQLNLIPKTVDFLNSDIPILGNPFTNNEKIRDVLSDIEEVACSYSEIDWDTNEIDLVWLSQSQTPDYVFDTGDYTDLEGGQVVYGPVNSLVIKNSQVEGENVSRDDEESIELNQETQITIEDNYFLYTEELRNLAIDNIWNRVKGLTYVDYKLTTSYGKPFLKCGNKIGIHLNNGRYIESYVLTHTFSYNGAFQSIISGSALTKQETQRKNNQGLIKKFRKTEIIVNKIEGEIENVIEQTDEQRSQLSQVKQTLEDVQNVFQITGGSNLIKDSQKLLGDDVWEQSETGNFIGGYDSSLVGKTTSVAKIGVRKGSIKTKDNNIIDLVIGQRYTLSFSITNETNTTTTVRLTGNNKVYEEIFQEPVSFKEVSVSFIAETSNYTFEFLSETTMNGWSYIYDLMLNSGDKKPWEPAKSEIKSTVLQMSQMGLRIFCTGSSTATLMTSAGFQVWSYRNGELYEVITEFTDKGIVTKLFYCTEIHMQKKVETMIKIDGIDHYSTYIEE